MAQSNPVMALVGYLKASKEELRKVSWPNREKIVQSTITVIIVSVVFALFLGLVDYLLSLGLESIL